MSENQITVVTDEVYDEMMRDTLDEPNETLRAAARRANEIIIRRA
jgi:hypothetical protein